MKYVTSTGEYRAAGIRSGRRFQRALRSPGNERGQRPQFCSAQLYSMHLLPVLVRSKIYSLCLRSPGHFKIDPTNMAKMDPVTKDALAVWASVQKARKEEKAQKAQEEQRVKAHAAAGAAGGPAARAALAFCPVRHRLSLAAMPLSRGSHRNNLLSLLAFAARMTVFPRG